MMPLPELERWSFWFRAGAIGFTGMAFLCSWGAFVFSQRVSERKDQIAHERAAEVLQAKREAADARKDAADARKGVEDVTERTRQRRLTPEQKNHLISALKRFRLGGFEIWGQSGDPEATAYTEQFMDVFWDVGWGRQAGILPDPDAPRGVTIRVHSKAKTPEYAARFAQAASEVGLHIAVSYDPNDPRLSDNRVYLIVGSKPGPPEQ